MRIILEGADNSGKTTLANMLQKHVPQLTYYHPGGRPANAKAEDDCLNDQYEMLQIDNVLMDRCTAISQSVYSPNEERDIGRALHLSNLVESGVMFVYCRPSTDWLMAFENFTWREGETDEFKQEIIDKQHVFIQRYDDLMQLVPHVHYDYKSDEAVAVFKHLVMAANGNDTSKQLLLAMQSFRVPKCK